MAPGGNAAEHHCGFPVTSDMPSEPYWSPNRLSHSAAVVTGVENGMGTVPAASTTPTTAHVRTTHTDPRARFRRASHQLARMRRA